MLYQIAFEYASVQRERCEMDQPTLHINTFHFNVAEYFGFCFHNKVATFVYHTVYTATRVRTLPNQTENFYMS